MCLYYESLHKKISKRNLPHRDGSMHECTGWLTKYTNKKSMHTCRYVLHNMATLFNNYPYIVAVNLDVGLLNSVHMAVLWMCISAFVRELFVCVLCQPVHS